MTVQASTNRGSTRRPKASVRRGIKRQSTPKGNLSGTCKRKRQKVKIEDTEYNITCVSMGNPHCIVYMDNIDDLDLREIGTKFEKNKMFPEGINTEFVEVIDEKTLKMRVWERGSGETLACGTGACAVAVASVLNGYCKKDQEIVVKLLGGGSLNIEWNKDDGHTYMTGPAEFVFEGEIQIP